MNLFFSQIAKLFQDTRIQAGIPRALLESAEARAGTNVRQARELRSAALAYLRVVR